MTVTVWSVGAGGSPCPAAGALWAGRPVRIQVNEFIRWDGLTPRTFRLTNYDGTVLTLTLSPATD
jgi:hypothetical protein